MKKIVFLAVASLLMASCSTDGGKVTIQLPKDFQDSTFYDRLAVFLS